MADKLDELHEVVASYMMCENCREAQVITSFERMNVDISEEFNSKVDSLCIEIMETSSVTPSFALYSNEIPMKCSCLDFKRLLEIIIDAKTTARNEDLHICSYNKFEMVLNAIYSQYEKVFVKELEFPYGVSFSPKIWINTFDNKSYLTLSCHYVNSEGLLRSVKYYTIEFPHEKSSDDLNLIFNDSIPYIRHFYQSLFVIDNSKKMLNTLEDDEECIQCICKVIDDCVQTIMNCLTSAGKEFEEMEVANGLEDPFALSVSLINQCQFLVSHFEDNELQTSLPRSLQICSSVSWIEVLGMLESISSQWNHIGDILAKRNELFPFDIKLLTLIVDFLNIFRDGFNELSSLTCPTLNLVLVWITKWKTYCLPIQDEHPLLAAMKNLMSLSIDEKVNITIYHNMATMLDPRYKDLSLIAEGKRLETQACAVHFVREFRAKKYGNNANVPLPEICKYSYLDIATQDIEVNEYLNEEFTLDKFHIDNGIKFNPLQYWVRTQALYPNLSKFAFWILSCPASLIQMVGSHNLSDWMITKHEIDLPSEAMYKYLFVRSFRND